MSPVELLHGQDYTAIISGTAVECPRCHVMRYWFICRGGGSVCIECDKQKERGA